ncbi:MAG: NAD(P)/FAD-dependent oxidoreductase [Acidimicrobiia bacterium]|nr:NAD(P)/FAD-dependent oxidoreductase [Acidimicrobiia bacterium]
MTTTDSHYDIAIIGAGPNGLTAAGYLSRAGAKVLLADRHHECGGGLITEEWSGFRFNTHAKLMMMMDVMPPFEDLDLESWGCTYLRPDVAAAIVTRDGRAMCFYADIERTARSIARFDADDAEAYVEVMTDWYTIVNEAIIPATYSLPLPLLDMAVSYEQTEVGRVVNEMAEESFVETLEAAGFESDLLKTAILYLGTMYGMDPEGGLGFLLPLFFNRLLHASVVRNGSHQLAASLARFANRNGTTIERAAEVAAILTDGPRATGIRFADGREVTAGAVISTADPQMTFLGLVGEEACLAASPHLVAQSQSWEWESTSLFNAHYALSERPRLAAADDDPDADRALVKIMGVETVDELLGHIESVKAGRFSTAIGAGMVLTDFDPMQAPVDIEPGTAVACWETLAPFDLADGSWDGKREACAKAVFETWTEYAPNLADTTVVRHYANDPTFIEAKLPNMVRGSIKHGAYVPTQMLSNRPNADCSAYRTPIENLYVAGASVWPGGMVLLGGGYNVAGVVADDLGLDRWWTEPEFVSEARKKGLVG